MGLQNLMAIPGVYLFSVVFRRIRRFIYKKNSKLPECFI